MFRTDAPRVGFLWKNDHFLRRSTETRARQASCRRASGAEVARHEGCSARGDGPHRRTALPCFQMNARHGIKRTWRTWIALAMFAAISVTFSSVARADVPPGVDWLKAIVELDQLARGGGKEADGHKNSPARHSGRPTTTDDPSPQNMGNAWFGVAPRVTLVARDWASSTRLAGDRLSLVDGMRLSASTRMVVGRARLSGTRFTPFLQVGVGQWRVDPNYLPLTPRMVEIASQAGTGFEVRLSQDWQLAVETTVTTLIRDGHHETIPQTMLWSTFVASSIEF